MIETFAAANVVIALGYAFLCLFVVPYMRITRLSTKVSGSVFFATCAMTHIEHTVHARGRTSYGFPSGSIEWHLLIVHVVQAISVVAFVIGLYRQFVLPERRAQAARGKS